MDADESLDSVERISYFSTSPDLFPWRDPRPQQIETRRAQMSDVLIFDILLTSGGLRQPDTLYPPSDIDHLERLLAAIQNSSYDTLKKNCLVYFLLKWHQDGREDKFREEKCIPPQFAALADAYWYLDSGIDETRAVSILSDARLNRDYASKILQALSLAEDSSALIVKYVRTAKPPLIEPDDIDTYITALAESNMLDAWQYQRTFPEIGETRSRVIKKVLDWCLSPKPRFRPLQQLMAFTFTDYEKTVIHDYALHPPPTCPSSSIPIVQDLVCVRLIQAGQHASAIKLDRQIALASTNATGRTKNAMSDRKRMMDDIMAAMPAVERKLLESELEQLTHSTSQPSTTTLGRTDSWTSSFGTSSMTMSWEHISPTRPAVNGFSTPSKAPALESLAVNGSNPPLVPVSRNLFATTPVKSSQPNFLASTSPGNPLWASASKAGPSTSLQRTAVPNPLTPRAPTAAANLFHSIASANRTRNAFYEPPPLNGVKRPFQPETPPPEQQRLHRDDHMNVDSEDETHHRRDVDDVQDHQVEEAPEQLPFSVFSHATESDATGHHVTRTETETKMPPGAFFPDSDDESKKTRHRSRSRTAPPPQKAKQTRSSRAQQPTKVQNPTRRLPGALMEDNEDEEDDYVAPLPSLKRPSRRGRSRSEAQDENAAEMTRPRRSSRLSATPSSPEQAPSKEPSKPRRRTRTSTAVTTNASKTSTRKKR